jgi:hypothetical protein
MQLDDIRAVCDAQAQQWLAKDDVTAVGIGYLPGTTEIGIIIHITEPAKVSALAVPTSFNGVKVATKVGRFVHHVSSGVSARAPVTQLAPATDTKPAPTTEVELGNPRDATFEPMIGGVSANPNYWSSESMGTLGMAIKNASGQPVILSNYHVICRSNPAVGDEVAQPAHEILFHLAATLQDFILGNYTYNGAQYGMDAAIALPTNGRSAQLGAIYGFQGTVYTTAGTPNLGDLVTKSGLTSNITNGTVTQINTAVKNDSGAILKNQILIQSTSGADFSEQGDSGSVIINSSTSNAVALLWGGNDQSETVASPIIPILARFNCTIS